MHPESPLLPNLPSSRSLDVYRKQASFSWKRLATVIDEDKIIELKVSEFFQNIYSKFIFNTHLCVTFIIAGETLRFSVQRSTIQAKAIS